MSETIQTEKTRKPKEPPARRAYDFDEFGAIFGRSRGWTYRMVKEKKIRAITGYGKMMVAASEIDRIFGSEVTK